MGANATRSKRSTKSKCVAEVATLWSDTVVQVKQLESDGRSPARFEIGEDPSCDMFITLDTASHQAKLPLVEASRGGVTVRIPREATISLERAEATHNTAEELVTLGLACVDTNGDTLLTLEEGWVAQVGLGEIDFRIRRTHADELEQAALPIDWSSIGWTAASFFVHAVFLALIFAVPPASSGISLDEFHQGNRFVSYLVAPPEIDPPQVPDFVAQQAAMETEEEVEPGAAHQGEGGMMGDPNESQRDRHYTIRDRGGDRVQLGREELRDMARNSGILAALRNNAPSSPFSTTGPNGLDAEDQLGALLGSQPGASFGYGGLGVIGTGRGGNGREGNISLGTLVTNGRFGNRNPNAGAHEHARLEQRSRRSQGPTIRHGVASVGGALPREVIRRQIRLRRAQIAHCYQRELTSRPDLAGRVSIRFVIDQQGRVVNAVVAGDSLDSPSVGQCVANVIRMISFPSPDNGVVVVNYPFTFVSQD